MSENNGSSVFVELLRGRDGLPGRDGVQGPPGPQGKDGSPGPKSGGATYTRWGKSTCPQLECTKILSTQGSLEGHSTPMKGRWSQLPLHAQGPRVQHYINISRWSKRSCIYTWSRISESSTRITKLKCSLCCML